MTVYGIKNCDTVKKARKWLEQRDIAHQFHDFRADGIAASEIESWFGRGAPVALVNKRSTSWKQLDAEQRTVVEGILASISPDQSELSGLAKTKAKQLAKILAQNPTLIKRPVLLSASKTAAPKVGFSEASYKAQFS